MKRIKINGWNITLTIIATYILFQIIMGLLS